MTKKYLIFLILTSLSTTALTNTLTNTQSNESKILICSGYLDSPAASVKPIDNYTIFCNNGSKFDGWAFLSEFRAKKHAESLMFAAHPKLVEVDIHKQLDESTVYTDAIIDQNKQICMIQIMTFKEYNKRGSFNCNFLHSELNSLRIDSYMYEKVIADLKENGFATSLSFTYKSTVRITPYVKDFIMLEK